MKKYKGKTIYLKADEQGLVVAALDFYNKHLQKKYEESIKDKDVEEWYLDTSLKIRNLLSDKFKKNAK